MTRHSTPAIDLTDTHVVITGGSRGIGRALADCLAVRGARLSLIGRDKETLDRAAADTGALPIVADLADMSDVERILPAARAANGPVTVLVNNAAVNIPGPLATCGRANLRDRLTTNLLAPLELTRDALQDMLAHKRGSIVNISSLIGDMAVRNVIPYAASKSALGLATRALRRELKGTGVTAQLVVFGAVDTQMYNEDTFIDPIAGQSAARLGKISPQSPVSAAHAITKFLGTGKEVLVVPRVVHPVHGLRFLPTRLADLLLIGIPRSVP
ncbi:SDR family oxidoreductase [Mycobacterium sp.]|uniref:SDR family NAD(P)-dependent oxidoreductase n=1 Tax=Mycobacterium sp. TaxID=1785 RepID=UPI00120D5A36|nr:SDR family oxidoreductase [Mycobacterium sp.]TAM62842.1 MAG: SDR family oxidoreductase [Mycobacterium sp.]